MPTLLNSIARRLEHSAMEIPGMPVQRERIWTMAKILADIGTSVDEQHLALLGRLGMASFAFDDLVDAVDESDDLSVPDLLQRAEQLAACAADTYVPELAFDPLARFVARAAADLRRHPAAAALWPDWVEASRRMFVGIVEHRVLGHRLWSGDRPTLAEMIQVGARSIGTEVFSVAAWILLGTPALARVRDRLWEVNHRLARATRIANDLRTVAKDGAERGPNVLFLVGDSAGLEARVHEDLADALSVLETLPPNAHRPVGFTIDLARRIVGVYQERDFHERAA